MSALHQPDTRADEGRASGKGLQAAAVAAAAQRAVRQDRLVPDLAGRTQRALVVQWGAPLSPEGKAADAILAYVKTVPEQGGNVLMQDSMTINKMTADEFKTAPKASSR